MMCESPIEQLSSVDAEGGEWPSTVERQDVTVIAPVPNMRTPPLRSPAGAGAGAVRRVGFLLDYGPSSLVVIHRTKRRGRGSKGHGGGDAPLCLVTSLPMSFLRVRLRKERFGKALSHSAPGMWAESRCSAHAADSTAVCMRAKDELWNAVLANQAARDFWGLNLSPSSSPARCGKGVGVGVGRLGIVDKKKEPACRLEDQGPRGTPIPFHR
jgi:hypothetical protein